MRNEYEFANKTWVRFAKFEKLRLAHTQHTPFCATSSQKNSRAATTHHSLSTTQLCWTYEAARA
jgi:hypothetical protein